MVYSCQFSPLNFIHFFLSPIRATCCDLMASLDLIARILSCEGVQIIKLFGMYSSTFPCYFFPRNPKYSPQHPILEHPHPMFFPQRERPSFTAIQNKRQNYSSVYFNLYIFEWQIGRQKIQLRMIESIFRIKKFFLIFL